MTWLLLVGILVGLLGTFPVAQADTPNMTLLASSTSAFPGSFTRNLYKGCTGSDVKVLQRALKDLGYYTGAVDGIFGSNTKTAVQNFQRKNGLSVDGIAGRNTMRVLISGSAVGPSGSGSSSSGYLPAGRTYLAFGDENEQVLALQKQLMALGYYSGPLSSYFGSQTLAAVRSFQSRNSIGVDGLAGRITLSLLFSGNAIPAYGNVKPTASPTPSTSWRILRYGMVGTDVAEAQKRLYNLGYYTGIINGEYNSDTRTAVMNFQARNWLTVDGIIGEWTYIRLFSVDAVAAQTKPGVTATPTPTPTPTPSPTPTQTQQGNKCPQCDKVVVNAADHQLAACAVSGHYRCTVTDLTLHTTNCAQCGKALCTGSHNLLGCGHYACDGKNHATLSCGHYACASGTHAIALCGNHYQCQVSAELSNHMDILACGKHYYCQVSAELPNHTVVLACGKHYLCQVSKPDAHTVNPCPY